MKCPTCQGFGKIQEKPLNKWYPCPTCKTRRRPHHQPRRALDRVLRGNPPTPMKAGQKVRLKSDGRIYTIYAVYSKTHVSLGLHDYPDTEQDFQTNINELEVIT